jgi:hypothetical protein
MLVSLATKQFLESVDTMGYQKIVRYQASITKKYIEEVGLHNVVQICIDNASSMKVAANIITNKYPHIYFEIHKETIQTTHCFLQVGRQVEFVDARKNQIWIKLHNG